jgi:4a-hydroxytetrahydrobiopterin dehydratase
MIDLNLKESLSTLHTDWILSENQDLLSRRFELTTFTEALDLVNKIGKIAEEQGHHPDINLGWGYVEIYLSTHDIGGITDKDIILAKAIDNLS